MATNRRNVMLVYGVPLLLIATIIALTYAPQGIDWRLSFSKKHTRPYGAKALFEVMPAMVKNYPLVTLHGNIDSYAYFDSLPSNYVFINQTFFPDEVDFEALMYLLDNGQNVFISAEQISDQLRDTLKVGFENPMFINVESNDSVSFNFANRRLKTQLGYWYDKGITNNTFAKYDTLHTTVLGFNNKGKTNFIRTKIGDGWLYLHLNPLVFTNYNLLKKDNYEYAFKCLSYLPEQRTVWDEHYKPGMQKRSHELGLLLERWPFRLAYYLLLIGILLYYIFDSARRQRLIPIIKPLENSTVSFVSTVGRLYFSRKNHLDIAQKRFLYFTEFIRSSYYEDTSLPNEEFFKRLSDKSGISQRSIEQLFMVGTRLKKISELSEADLEQFNRKIDYFYENCQ